MDIEEMKDIFAKNLISLRKATSITQAELASKLNYSDKAISKWERGDAIPDIYMLKQIADLFGVNVDYLITEHNNENIQFNLNETEEQKKIGRNHLLIILVSVFGIWALAIIMFMIFTTMNVGESQWMLFIYPIPTSFLLAFIFSTIWGRKIHRIILLSFFAWTILLCLFLIFTIYLNIPNAWLLFILGIPTQIIMILSFGFKFQKKQK